MSWMARMKRNMAATKWRTFVALRMRVGPSARGRSCSGTVTMARGSTAGGCSWTRLGLGSFAMEGEEMIPEAATIADPWRRDKLAARAREEPSRPGHRRRHLSMEEAAHAYGSLEPSAIRAGRRRYPGRLDAGAEGVAVPRVAFSEAVLEPFLALLG